jgi:pyrimidine operon attenuation protein/uracil phosphoribosyltransferase
VDGDLNEITKYPIILCDDVLNTGKTLAYSLSKFLSWEVKKIETAVLILRSYSQFPIYATYKGYQLSTTINEHVNVVPGEGVFLN